MISVLDCGTQRSEGTRAKKRRANLERKRADKKGGGKREIAGLGRKKARKDRPPVRDKGTEGRTFSDEKGRGKKN